MRTSVALALVALTPAAAAGEPAGGGLEYSPITDAISLERLLDQTDLVVLVEADRPPRRDALVPIPAGDPNEPAPPFVVKVERFVVLEVLHNPRARPVPARIEAVSPHAAEDLVRHEQRVLDRRESVALRPHYRSRGAYADPEAPRIAYLRARSRAEPRLEGALAGVGFELAAEDAYDLPGERVRVERVLDARRRRAAP